MWHILKTTAKHFFHSLQAADEIEAEQIRREGCRCGGRLHRADYPRKPRGVPEECESLVSRRISFCCAEPNCRRRTTPQSVRFLGRRVYVAAFVLMVSASWVSTREAQVPGRTARRWRGFFTKQLVEAAQWQERRAWFMPPLDESALPGSLMSRFAGSRDKALFSSLVFLAPMGGIPMQSAGR